MSTTQYVDLTNGAVEYTYPLTITETTGKNIAADVITLSLGTDTTPGTWRSPDTDPVQVNHAQRVVQMLIGGTGYVPLAGSYWLWSKVTDSPEVVPRRHCRVVVT
jgi:hypothetical protein